MADWKAKRAIVCWLVLVGLAPLVGALLTLSFAVPGFPVPPAAALMGYLGTGVLAVTLARICWPRPEIDNGPFYYCIYCMSPDHDGADCPTKEARRG